MFPHVWMLKPPSGNCDKIHSQVVSAGPSMGEPLTDFATLSSHNIIFTWTRARAVISRMDQTNWKHSKLRLQNLVKSQIQMLRCFLPSPTHLEGYVYATPHSIGLIFLRTSQINSSVMLFYNAPQPPSGIFDAFLQLPNQQEDIKTRSYADLVQVQASPTTSPVGLR
jgi:hypothetical protein